MARPKRKKKLTPAQKKKKQQQTIGIMLLAGAGLWYANEQGWLAGLGAGGTEQAGIGFQTSDDSNVNFLSPREKYYYDIRNEQPGDALEIYRRNWANNVNDLQTRFPDIATFWAWLWNQKTYMAYKSYNQQQQWLPEERVISIQ